MTERDEALDEMRRWQEFAKQALAEVSAPPEQAA